MILVATVDRLFFSLFLHTAFKYQSEGSVLQSVFADNDFGSQSGSPVCFCRLFLTIKVEGLFSSLFLQTMTLVAKVILQSVFADCF